MKSLVRFTERLPLDASLLPHATAFDFSGAAFEVRATGPAVPAYLDRVYAYFRRGSTPTAGPVRRMHIIERGTPTHALLPSRLRVPRALTGHVLALDWLDWALVLEDLTLLDYYASKLLRLAAVEVLGADFHTLHAASLCGEGAGLLLIGEAAAGKTSLTLRLIEHGFRYGADDTTPLRRGDLRCVPFPTPFIVRADLNSGQPPLPELVGRPPDIALLDEPRWLVERWDSIAPPFRPTHLLFLGDTPATGGVEEMPASEAVLELLRNTVFPLGADVEQLSLESTCLESYLELVEGARAWRINTTDLSLALQHILALLAGRRLAIGATP